MATERFLDTSYDPEKLVLKRSPARKTLMGKKEPATVTLREEDFYALAVVRQTALGAQEAANSMKESEQRMESTAEEINRNRIDSHEISVDQRVRKAERRVSEITEQANKEIRKAKALAQRAQIQLKEIQQDRDHIRNELTELQEISAFFPKEWREKWNKRPSVPERWRKCIMPPNKEKFIRMYHTIDGTIVVNLI